MTTPLATTVIEVVLQPPPTIDVEVAYVGPQGATGAPGVVSATAPATYDSGTRVVGVAVGTVTGTVAAGDDARITGAAQKSSNLADLADSTAARANLGLGSAATHAATDFDTTGAAAAALNTATGRAAAFALVLGG